MRAALTAGAVLGVLSRVEETTPGLDLGISTNFTWLGIAFLAGAHASEHLDWSGLAGALALTAANLGYYAWIALAEAGTPLDAVAGPVDRWFALGATGGFVLGAAGAGLRCTARARRAAAAVPLAALLAAQNVPRVAELLP